MTQGPDEKSEHICAPWTDIQVDTLNAYQGEETMHPHTCLVHSSHLPLVATRDGWLCPTCGARQEWVAAWVADGRWREYAATVREWQEWARQQSGEAQS